MISLTKRSSHGLRLLAVFFSLAACLILVLMPLNQMRTRAQSQKSGAEAGDSVELVPALGNVKDFRAPARRVVNSITAVGKEVEPNDTPATATPLGTTPVRVRGDLFKAPFASGVDVDVYSFTAGAGDRVYAATMTGASGGSTDTTLDIIASDGTTVLESDDEDGTIGGSASNIAGTLLATPGTYYVRVNQFSIASLSGTIRPYDLYVRVLSGAPTPETEPNNNGTPQALPPGGWVSGAIAAAGDNDTFTFSANAGDTIIAILDADPERDAPEWNPRLGIGNFNNFILLANGSAVGGTFDDANPSEALMMTVNTTGTYQIYVDEALAGGAAADTYNVMVSVIPGNVRSCTTYSGGTTGAITDAGITNFTLNIPDSRLVHNLQLTLSETHGAAATADLDVSLIAPDGNEVVLFDDPPTTATAPAPQINTTIYDEAAIPISLFGIHSGTHYAPELYARMAYFNGEQAQGIWTLRVRDDLAGNTGTLNSWSLTICDDIVQVCTVPETTILSTDFEASDAGFTHSGVQDEWARGLPSGASAPITTCHSGVNCWKTDLVGTYNASANNDLLSPNINLTAITPGTPIKLRWWQKYQMESASFDPFWVEVREVGNPTNFRKVFEWKGATQTRGVGNPVVTVQMSAGWGQQEADISSFAGLNVEVRYHMETDSSGQFSGLAVDDFLVTACNGPTAANGVISGRILDSGGAPVAGTVVNLSGSQSRKTITDNNGNYHFNNVETNGFYTVTPARANYMFSPSQRSFSLVGTKTDAIFSGSFTSDNANPLDTAEYFVRQQYRDVLSREPDEVGFNYWSDQINACGGDAECTRSRRTGVAAAFFIEPEAQRTGSFIYNLYEGALGRRPAFGEYATDRPQVIGGANLEAKKAAFAQSFVQRAEFADRYQGNATGESFVDALLANLRQSSGVDLTSQRGSLISRYHTGSNQTESRSFVLRDVTESAALREANYNASFVLTEYFSYLGRNPDTGGYNFWLNVLNDGDNYRGMVCSFITSREYQRRFSSIVSHSNAECEQ